MLCPCWRWYICVQGWPIEILCNHNRLMQMFPSTPECDECWICFSSIIMSLCCTCNVYFDYMQHMDTVNLCSWYLNCRWYHLWISCIKNIFYHALSSVTAVLQKLQTVPTIYRFQSFKMNYIFISQESLFSFYLEGSLQSLNNCNSDSLVTGWCREDISPSTDYSVHTAVHRPAPLTEDPHWDGQCCGASIMWTSVNNIIWPGVTAHAHTQLSVWWLPPPYTHCQEGSLSGNS